MSYLHRLFRWPAWLVAQPARWLIFLAVLIPVFFLLEPYTNNVTVWIPTLFCTWILLVALWERPVEQRISIGLVIVLATIAEVLFSMGLGWYDYRIGHVPPWIPPAHGIVFLTALVWADIGWARTRHNQIRVWLTAAVLAYTAYGLAGGHPDIIGAITGGLFLLWLWTVSTERSILYVMMWIVVCYLEILGTAFGTWTWAPTALGLTEGNPPSGIVGMYGIIDLVALLLTVPAYAYYRQRRNRQQTAQSTAGQLAPVTDSI